MEGAIMSPNVRRSSNTIAMAGRRHLLEALKSH
jgi:hypothetical protein